MPLFICHFLHICLLYKKMVPCFKNINKVKNIHFSPTSSNIQVLLGHYIHAAAYFRLGSFYFLNFLQTNFYSMKVDYFPALCYESLRCMVECLCFSSHHMGRCLCFVFFRRLHIVLRNLIFMSIAFCCQSSLFALSFHVLWQNNRWKVCVYRFEEWRKPFRILPLPDTFYTESDSSKFPALTL